MTGLKKVNIFDITTYEYNGFYIDIVEKSDAFEAWLYKDSIAIKSLLLGTPKKQANEVVTLNNFIDYVMVDIDSDIELYLLEYDN